MIVEELASKRDRVPILDYVISGAAVLLVTLVNGTWIALLLWSIWHIL